MIWLACAVCEWKTEIKVKTHFGDMPHHASQGVVCFDDEGSLTIVGARVA
jgi:hypothetical protein